MQNSGSVTLSELLSPARIKLELESNDRESVLGELVNCIPNYRIGLRRSRLFCERFTSANNCIALE
jgi:hypothetical protein